MQFILVKIVPTAADESEECSDNISSSALCLGFPCTLFTFVGWHLSWYNSLTTRQWIPRERGPVSFPSFSLSSLLFLTTVLPPIFPCFLWLGRFIETTQIYVPCVGWCLRPLETNLLETVNVTFLPNWKISGLGTMHSKSISVFTILDRCLQVQVGQIVLSVSPTSVPLKANTRFL